MQKKLSWLTDFSRVHFIMIGLLIGLVGLICITAFPQRPAPGRYVSRLQLADIPFDGQRSFEHLEAICKIGPRIAGTPGMLKQQEYLKAHFEKLGGKVTLQSFTARHPETGMPVDLANLIVEWHPEKKNRVLFCAHYDTRPYPDQELDANKRREPFIGANDGASGAALLCELGTHMADYKGPYGVDFCLFDAEELIYDRDRDKYFLGSEHFSTDYVTNPPAHKYKYGVLLDMVGDKELQIFYERNSMNRPGARAIVNDIWANAKRLQVKEFIPLYRHEVRDDHLPLNDIAKIPTCDVIDFDYPRPGTENYWHTTQDIPENCSALSLAKVGYVLHEWLKRLK